MCCRWPTGTRKTPNLRSVLPSRSFRRAGPPTACDLPMSRSRAGRRQALSATFRSRVGVRRTRGFHRGLFLRERSKPTGAACLVQRKLWGSDPPCGAKACQCFWTARCARERVGVGAGLLQRLLRRGAHGRQCMGAGGLFPPASAGRFLVHQPSARACRQPKRERRSRPGQQHWLPSCQDRLTLGSCCLYLLPSGSIPEPPPPKHGTFCGNASPLPWPPRSTLRIHTAPAGMATCWPSTPGSVRSAHSF